MYLAIDGTGVPMRKDEVEGIAGKQEDGSAKTREAKLAVIYTAEGRDPETGVALKDTGSETFSCLVDSAAVPPGSRDPSGFAMRLDREALRRGLHGVDELVVISGWRRMDTEHLRGVVRGPEGHLRARYVPCPRIRQRCGEGDVAGQGGTGPAVRGDQGRTSRRAGSPR